MDRDIDRVYRPAAASGIQPANPDNSRIEQTTSYAAPSISITVTGLLVLTRPRDPPNPDNTDVAGYSPAH